MRRKDEQQMEVFSYVSPEQRVPQDHPLPSLRFMTDEALRELQPRFNKLCAETGRPSIAPEKLLRALLLQALYSVRSERLWDIGPRARRSQMRRSATPTPLWEVRTLTLPKGQMYFGWIELT
jgi:hypothetical protein